MVSGAALSVDFLLAAGGATLLLIGAVAALLSGNAIKRVGGLLICGLGSVAALAAMGVGNAALVTVIALLFVYAVLGTALVIRLQESYGAIETPEIDGADANSDVREPTS